VFEFTKGMGLGLLDTLIPEWSNCMQELNTNSQMQELDYNISTFTGMGSNDLDQDQVINVHKGFLNNMISVFSDPCVKAAGEVVKDVLTIYSPMAAAVITVLTDPKDTVEDILFSTAEGKVIK